MARLLLQLPTIQNWSCHNCSGCCRQHAIEVTPDEQQRILDQKWSPETGVPADQPLFETTSGWLRSKTVRLAHQSDGGCVFLQGDGLCRIHARFEESAKPLACRVYPYALHPAGRKITVSLRYSCPSVVANKGRPVSEQRGELKKIAAFVVPRGAARTPPPSVLPGQQVEWPDFLRFVEHLDLSFEDSSVPFNVRLLRTLFWVNLVGQSRFDSVVGQRLEEFLELIAQAAREEVPEQLPDDVTPTRAGFLQFRTLVGQYARRDTSVDSAGGVLVRWKLFRNGLRFARGRGDIPAVQECFREVPFAALEGSFGALPSEADEILARYVRVKIQGIHFCGPAYYNVPLVEGFRALALIVPAIFWIARWLAVSDQRSSLTTEDIVRAVTIADHHHGYSPAFGTAAFRRRVRLLATTNDIDRLVMHYAK